MISHIVQRQALAGSSSTRAATLGADAESAVAIDEEEIKIECREFRIGSHYRFVTLCDCCVLGHLHVSRPVDRNQVTVVRKFDRRRTPFVTGRLE